MQLRRQSRTRHARFRRVHPGLFHHPFEKAHTHTRPRRQNGPEPNDKRPCTVQMRKERREENVRKNPDRQPQPSLSNERGGRATWARRTHMHPAPSILSAYTCLALTRACVGTVGGRLSRSRAKRGRGFAGDALVPLEA